MTGADRTDGRAVGGLALWRVRTALHRSGTQWRLLAVVSAVALLVGTMLSSLTLLLVTTEQTGVRGALTAAPPGQRDVSVTVTDLEVQLGEARESVDAAVRDLVAPAGTSAESMALTGLQVVARVDDTPAVTYLAEVEGLAAHATVVEGGWPTAVDAGGRIPVAVPAALAEELGLGVGDPVDVGTVLGSDRPTRLTVVGTFDTTDPGTRFWSADPLAGAGADDAFVVPGTGGSVTTDAYGPLVVAEGGLAGSPAPVEELLVRHVADLSGAEVGHVRPLLTRLEAAPRRLPGLIGDVGRSVDVTTTLTPTVREVGSALVVTRAGVVVVALLLAVLAVAALLQTSRLLAEARSGEQNLMRARGASGRQLLQLAGVEAAALAVLTAVAGPLLAREVYGLLARRPAMVEAGMAVDPGLPAAVWLTAGAAAALFGLVLVTPLLRRATTFVEGEQARARPDRRSVLTRSGLDLGLVVLAGVAYWQLQSYRSPLTSSGSGMRLDPVLVAGPAVVLLAGALLCVRLVPAASRLTERFGAGGRGVVGPLAAWEVGRRSQRATAAVLLLTLALAVGTFSQTFLATWRLSQQHQAEFAVGPPVRVEARAGAELTEASALADGEHQVWPVVRSRGELTAPENVFFGGQLPRGRATQVLAAGEQARAMLDVGRLAEEGGREVAGLRAPAPEASGIDLPETLQGLAAEVRIGDPDAPRPGLVGTLRAVLEDTTGLVWTLDLVQAPVDGTIRDVQVWLPDDVAGDGLSGPVRLVGLQAVTYTVTPSGDVSELAVHIPFMLRSLESLGRPASEDDDPVRTAVEVPDGGPDWAPVGRSANAYSTQPDDGWDLGLVMAAAAVDLRFSVPAVSLVGWPVVAAVPAVISQDTADALNIGSGHLQTLVTSGALVPVTVQAVVPRLPSADDEAVVLDQRLLARTLAQLGYAGTAVDEWWVDVPDDEAVAWVAALGEDPSGLPTADRATGRAVQTLAMQQHPLRVATQGALWLVTLAAAVLAAVGFAVHAAVTLRARSVEFAQLRAVGLPRAALTAVVGVESLLLCTLGGLFGIGLGALLGWLVGPLVAVSATGAPPVPSVLVDVPWAQVGLLALEVAVVLAVVVLVVARTQRSADPASVLRLGDER